MNEMIREEPFSLERSGLQTTRPIPPELLAHWLDHYGQCARDNGKQNDCYHGKDAAGRDNGCLRVGWLGRACKHWTPISGNELTWLIAAHSVRS